MNIPAPKTVVALVRERFNAKPEVQIVTVDMFPRASYDGEDGSIAYDLVIHWRETSAPYYARDVVHQGWVLKERRKRNGKPPFNVALFNGAYGLTSKQARKTAELVVSNLRFNARYVAPVVTSA